MTFKANIGVDPRVFYTQKGGDDNAAGTSLETAKLTIQGSVDAVNALSEAPNAINRAAIIVSGAGVFSENLSFPNFTSVDGSGATNAVASGTNYILGSFSNYAFGLATHSGASQIVFNIASETAVSLTCTEISITGDGTTGISVSGTTDDTFCRVPQLRLNGDGAIGINHTAANGEPEVFLLGSVTLEDDNVVCYIHNPSDSTARAVLDIGSISSIGSPTGTTAIRIIDGHLSTFFNEINATTGLDVQGGVISAVGNCMTANITVAVGATLHAEIIEFTGTITNNGTIIGRIGDEYFTTGVVTTSDTLTANTLVVGNGGVDVVNVANVSATDNGTNAAITIGTPANNGTAALSLTDESATEQYRVRYSDSGTVVNVTSPVEIATDGLFLHFESSRADTVHGFSFEQTGANGASFNLTAGTRDPTGIVTGALGDLYVRADVVPAGFFQNTGGGTNWTDIFGGHVTTSDVLTAGAMVIGNGGVDIAVEETLRVSQNNLTLQIDADQDIGTIEISDEAATQRIALIYNDSLQESIFAFPLGITFSHPAGDSQDFMSFDSTGPSGAVVDLHIGNRNPDGNVTALDSIYFRGDGASTDIYVQQAAALSPLGWRGVFETIDTKTTGPGTVVSGTLPYFDDTTGFSLGGDSILTYTTSGNNRFLDFNHDVLSNGFAELRWFNSVASEVANILYRYDNDDWIFQNFVGDLLFTGQTNVSFFQNSVTGTFGFTSGGNESQPILSLSRFSDQAGGTDLYVSNRTPVGNVLASPGSIAVEQTGATSKLRIHRGAGDNNTSWFPIVTGPNTTTVVNAAAVFDITTGDGINDISEVLITGGATADITIGTTSTNGTSALLFQDDVAAQTASLLFDHITNRLTLSSIDDIVIVSSGGTIDLEAFAGETINLIQAGGTANSVFEIDRTGTSGASHFWYINNVTPEGLVNGNPGDVASMVAGASSDIFMQRNSVTATTGWQGVFANLAGKMNTASSASTNALLKFSNGSGNDVEEIDWLTDSSSGSTTQLSIQHNTGVGGSTGLRFLDNGGTKFVTMALLESSQEFVVTSSLGDMILQCNRATIIPRTVLRVRLVLLVAAMSHNLYCHCPGLATKQAVQIYM